MKSSLGGEAAPEICGRNGVGIALQFKPAPQPEIRTLLAVAVGVALLVQANGFDAQPSSPSDPSPQEKTDQGKTAPARNVRPEDPTQGFCPR